MSNQKRLNTETDNRKSKRKAFLKKAQKQNPGQEIVWKDGQLIFAKNKQPVPEIPLLAKPERPAPSIDPWNWNQ